MTELPPGAIELPMFFERHTMTFRLIAPYSGKIIGCRVLAWDQCNLIMIPGPVSNVEAGASLEHSHDGGMH